MDNEEKACIRVEWEPGVEINSEAEYITMTQHLAKDLLSDHTPEQLAIIAAQHIIYTDMLKRTKEAQGEVTQLEILKNEILLKRTAQIVNGN